MKDILTRKPPRTLEQFVQQAYQGEALLPAQAIRNLEEGVIEIVYDDGSHRANGLLLTTDGYFLTADHCLGEEYKTMRVRTQAQRQYRIKRIVARDNQHDLVLGKMRGELWGQANVYRLYTERIAKTLPVALLTRRDGIVQRKYGFVHEYYMREIRKEHEVFLPFFAMVLDGRPGDSGGIVITREGQLIGLHRGSVGNIMYGVRILKALELVYSGNSRKEAKKEKSL